MFRIEFTVILSRERNVPEVLGQLQGAKVVAIPPRSNVDGGKIVFLLGFLVVWGYPFLFLVVSGQWFLLLVYTATTGGFFMTLKTFLCTQCMNMACPLNAVDEETRDRFFKQNPVVLNAWKDNMLK